MINLQSLSRAATSLIRIVAIVAALSVCLGRERAAGEEGPKAPPVPESLRPILESIPWQDAETAERMSKELVNLGAKGVADLVSLVVEPGEIDDSKARYAVHGLALYVSRPGAEAQRKMFCEVLGGMLGGQTPKSVQAMLIRQLRLAGGPESVAAISKGLLDERLCEDASHALVGIGGEEAKAALRKALGKAQGRRRATIVQNLGVMRDHRAAADLVRAAKDPDRDVRLAAVYALGNIGDASAARTLLVASEAEALQERAAATDAVLLLARRLGDAGRTGDAEQIYRTLWKTRDDPAERHVRCAAIQGLAAVLGIGAMDDLVAAMKSDDPQIRAAAIEAAVAMPGEEVTKRWIGHMESVPADSKPGIIALLARRGGDGALGAILDAMRERDEAVRLAAIEAARSFESDRAAPLLIGFLASESTVERDVARRSLERIPGDEASAAVASALGAASSEVRRDLLGVLMARGAGAHADAILAATKDQDKGVQEAALAALGAVGEEKHVPALLDIVVETDDRSVRGAAEKALGAVCDRSSRDRCVKMILVAMEKAGVDARCALIRILAKVPTAGGLEAVRAALGDQDEKIQDAAVRALSAWPDRAVAPALLKIARSGRNQTQQVLALRGYVRVVREQRMNSAEKVAMYKEAMAVARRPDEKRMILSALAEVKDIEAVKMLIPLLDDEGMREEAAAAAVRIGRDLRGDVRKEPLKGIVTTAMRKVLEVSGNDTVRRDAKRVLREAERK